MQRAANVFVCVVLLSAMGASMACDLSTSLAPALEPLAALGLQCLVTDLLCLLQPLVSGVNDLVGLVLVIVFTLVQLISSLGMNVGTLLSGLTNALQQALGNLELRGVLINLITTLIRVLPQVLSAVVNLLSQLIG